MYTLYVYYFPLYLACQSGRYGISCAKACGQNCQGCNRFNGVCEFGCHPGWTGTFCEKRSKYSDILFSAHNPYCFCILPIQNTLLLFKSMILVETMSIQVYNVHVWTQCYVIRCFNAYTPRSMIDFHEMEVKSNRWFIFWSSFYGWVYLHL